MDLYILAALVKEMYFMFLLPLTCIHTTGTIKCSGCRCVVRTRVSSFSLSYSKSLILNAFLPLPPAVGATAVSQVRVGQAV